MPLSKGTKLNLPSYQIYWAAGRVWGDQSDKETCPSSFPGPDVLLGDFLLNYFLFSRHITYVLYCMDVSLLYLLHFGNWYYIQHLAESSPNLFVIFSVTLMVILCCITVLLVLLLPLSACLVWFGFMVYQPL